MRAVCLIFALMSSPAAVAAELKIATVVPEGSAWMREFRAAGKDIQQKTGGRVVLKIYGGGIQGSDKKVLRKIRIGQLQGGVFTPNGLSERYPDIILYGLPMLFDSVAEVDYVRRKLDPVLKAGLDKAGFVSYGFAGGGFAYLMANKPVAGLADLRGQKIWVPEGDQPSYRAMEALELAPVVLPLTDVVTGLETGLLNIVATPPVGAVVLQWYTKVQYVMDQPLSYTLGFTAIDKKALAGVSPADQKVLSDVMTAAYVRLDQQNRVDDTKAIAALKANGLKFITPDPADLPRWRSAVGRANDGLAAAGTVSPALLRQVRALVAEFRAKRQAGAPASRPQ
jgi:TRAP-type transport system periplasmic protein